MLHSYTLRHTHVLSYTCHPLTFHNGQQDDNDKEEECHVKYQPHFNYAVLIEFPPSVGYLPFTALCKSLYKTWVRRCPVSCARSTQKFCGKNKNNMKRQNGVRATYDAFLLHALQAGFGYATVVNTSKEA